MSVYSDLLAQALHDRRGRLSYLDNEELTEGWEYQRRADRRTGTNVDSESSASTRIAGFIAGDLLLIEICRHLGVQERLADPSSGPDERARVERTVELSLIVRRAAAPPDTPHGAM
jgi:hypothetical protein